MPFSATTCKTISATAAFGLLATASSLAYAAPELPSREEMWKMIQMQQQQIEALQAAQKQTSQKVAETDKKVVETGEKMAQMEPAAGNGAPGWWERTQIGGYGEMHYNAMREDASDQIDFHRYVLFISHDFNENIRMFSEVELEHSLSGEGKPGEVELEQAFVEFDLNDHHRAKAGLFLLPVGILNETHEPPTFFGVERNPVENNIIPTTWWEGGAALSGQLSHGFSYDVALHSGLSVPTTGGSAFLIRSGRQKVANADADKGAVTGRLKWTGMPGVELGASAQYQQDVTQDNFTENVSATFFETHADVRRGPFGLRALFARWDLDGMSAAALGRDEQYGWYVEPSYRFDTPIGEAGVFARYNYWDNAAGDSVDSDSTQIDFGFNYWPHPDVVLKADVAFLDRPGPDDDEIANLGVGFQF